MPGSKHTQPAADSTGRPDEVVKARTVHEHLWPAVDVPLTEFPHADAMRSAVEACALPGGSLSYFAVSALQPGYGFRFFLETNAGHSQPSGAAQDRRLWVEWIAYDASGKEIRRMGVVDDGALEEPEGEHRECMFRDRLKDANDNEVHMFWEAASYESNLLLGAPKDLMLNSGNHTRRCDYRPFFSEPPARIDLRVRIRPMGMDVLQSLVQSQHLAPEVAARMPTFTLASYEITYDQSVQDYLIRDTTPADCNAYVCALNPDDADCQH